MADGVKMPNETVIRINGCVIEVEDIAKCSFQYTEDTFQFYSNRDRHPWNGSGERQIDVCIETKKGANLSFRFYDLDDPELENLIEVLRQCDKREGN